MPSLRVLDGQRFDTKFLERKKKQEANFKLMEKKQRLKREKQIKEQGMTADDDNNKRGKKRSNAESDVSDSKKKRRDDKVVEETQHDKDHMKATKEDHMTKKGTKRAAPAKEEQASSENNKAPKKSKTSKHEARADKEPKEPSKKKDTFFAPPEPEKADKQRPAPKEKPAVENKPTSKTVQQRSGVVGIVDKTKTQKKGPTKKKENENKQDIVDALLHAAEEEDDPTGTGLGIGGWDD